MKNIIIRNLKLILVILLLIVLFTVATFKEIMASKKTDFVMDTIMTVSAKGLNSKPVINKVFDRVAQIDKMMSAYNSHSDLTTKTLHNDTKAVIERGIYFGDKSNGRFDITIKPLVDLWDIKSPNPKVPLDSDIKKTLPIVDYRKVKFNGNELSLPKGMNIDLGGIAKGYAADEAIKILRENKIKDAIVDIGGNICVIGTKKVGIQNPLSVSTGDYIGIIEASDCSIVTSGSYERYFTQNAATYHHILDPITGYPTQSGLVSATIIGESSQDCDAIATIVFMMGEDGLDFAKKMGVKAIIVSNNNIVKTTGDINIEITDDRFKLED